MRPVDLLTRRWVSYAVAAAGVAVAYAVGGWCLMAPALALAGLALWGFAQPRREREALRQYEAALAALRANTQDPDRQRRAEEAGHAYSRATAGGHSEAAIRHDIEDATSRPRTGPEGRRRKKKKKRDDS
jgi:hypothetical protein